MGPIRTDQSVGLWLPSWVPLLPPAPCIHAGYRHNIRRPAGQLGGRYYRTGTRDSKKPASSAGSRGRLTSLSVNGELSASRSVFLDSQVLRPHLSVDLSHGQRLDIDGRPEPTAHFNLQPLLENREVG